MNTGMDEVVRQAQGGRADAFESLVDHYGPGIYRLAAAIVGPDDARDVAQESFVAAWRDLPNLRQVDRFDVWLRRIVINRSRNALRSRGRRPTQSRSACTLFAPEPFDAPDDQSVPAEVAIAANLPPGGDFDAGPEATSEEFTVDGVAAIRYDIPPGGFTTERTIVWIIAIAGNLPAEGNDQPFLALSTSSSDPGELEREAEVLDRMVATLDIGE